MSNLSLTAGVVVGFSQLENFQLIFLGEYGSNFTYFKSSLIWLLFKNEKKEKCGGGCKKMALREVFKYKFGFGKNEFTMSTQEVQKISD